MTVYRLGECGLDHYLLEEKFDCIGRRNYKKSLKSGSKQIKKLKQYDYKTDLLQQKIRQLYQSRLEEQIIVFLDD